LIDVPVIYSRYGTDRRASTSARRSSPSVYYHGDRGAGGAGMLFYAAASLVCEAVDYGRTRAAIMPRWRMRQQTHAILTDQRILVHAGGRWVSIDFDSITEFYPRFAASCVELHFGPESMPARLEGSAMPSIAAWGGGRSTVPTGYAPTPSSTTCSRSPPVADENPGKGWRRVERLDRHCDLPGARCD
jgi:hypothetical protein